MNETETIASIIWRIEWQVLAVQMAEYKKSKSKQEREQWKKLMLEKLVKINELAQIFKPQSIPQNATPPSEYSALAASGVNWCLRLTRELTCLFMRAPSAGTSRIEAE